MIAKSAALKFFAFTSIVAVVCGCRFSPEQEPAGRSSSGTGQSLTDPAGIQKYGSDMLDKARSFAAAELARMNAAEMLYRTQARTHEIRIPGTSQYASVRLKMYRQFTDFDVRDVKRSESLLTPLTFVITYHYDLFSTQERSKPNELALADKDTEFKLDGTYQITHEYPCSAAGEVAGGLPPLPSLPDAFDKGADPLGGIPRSFQRQFEN